MAEFSDEHRLLEAARKVRDSGYTDTDAFTPFPVHGIDEALGIKPTKLPFIVLCCGLTGLSLALLMQWWTNGVDYQYIISAKPMGITPASIPVAFEMTILFSAFSTFLGMLALNGLPKFSNPVFTNPRFDRATDDKFFLYVSAKDKYYNRDSVKSLLAGTNPEHLEEVIEDTSPANLPRFIWLGALLLVLTGLIPAAVILNMRNSNSPFPRFHVFFDMDFQPKKKAQQTTTIFEDGRSMRPQVAGTVARGQYDEADAFYLGYDPSQLAAISSSGARLVSAQDESEPAATEEAPTEAASQAEPATETTTEQPAPETPAETAPASEAQVPAQQEAATTDAAASADAAAPAQQLPWLTKFPLTVDDNLMKLGQLKYETYCAACHGYSGHGDGLVNRRASALDPGAWVPAPSLHTDVINQQAIGQLFGTITNGKGKMAPYAASLTPKERWAVVLYIKALQKSQGASLDDIPVDKRSEIKEVK